MKNVVSVITPVYNCEKWIEKSVMSALNQSEVLEVIVIDDGSTDSSLSICKLMQEKDKRIQILQHFNGVNKGRSASRNLGLRKAKGDYIAFLDGDDYYLKNRFKNDLEILEKEKECDGVYNAVAAIYYRKQTLAEKREKYLHCVTEYIAPDDLFILLLAGKHSHFHIDGLTVRRSIIKKVGFFNETLTVAEDTDLIWKMALKGRLLPSIIDQPLALRGIHDFNVFNRDDLYVIYYTKMIESVIVWSSRNKIQKKHIDFLLKNLWVIRFKENNRLTSDITYWASIFLPNPKLLLSILSIKYFPVVRKRKTLFSYFCNFFILYLAIYHV